MNQSPQTEFNIEIYFAKDENCDLEAFKLIHKAISSLEVFSSEIQELDEGHPAKEFHNGLYDLAKEKLGSYDQNFEWVCHFNGEYEDAWDEFLGYIEITSIEPDMGVGLFDAKEYIEFIRFLNQSSDEYFEQIEIHPLIASSKILGEKGSILVVVKGWGN